MWDAVDRQTKEIRLRNSDRTPDKRVGSTPVMAPVILNDVPTRLPAIHAAGDFFGDQTDFLFLDDPANPLTLKYHFASARSSR